MYFVPLAALAMASCSSDSVVEQTATQFGAVNGDLVFRPSVGNTSRGVLTTSSNLSSFDVIINGSFQQAAEWAEGGTTIGQISETLTGSGSDWAFTKLGDGEKYWWNDNTTEATFKAFAPSGASYANFKVSEKTVAQQIDLVTAYNSGLRDQFKTGVPLNFKHALSQILVEAMNTDASKVKVEVAGISIDNVFDEASLALPTTKDNAGTWSGWKTVNDYAAGSTAAENTSGISTMSASAANIMAGSPMLLIPQELSKSSNKPAIRVLVRITSTTKVFKRDINGNFVATSKKVGEEEATAVSGNDAIVPFNGYAKPKTEGEGYDVEAPLDGETANAYLAKYTPAGSSEVTLLDEENGTYTTYEGTTATVWTLEKVDEVIFPREGRGNASDKFAYVYASISTDWQAGYKYTYKLSFSEGNYGTIAADADQPDYTRPSDCTLTETNIYPNGVTDYGVGGEATEPYTPDEPIVDNPVPLIFSTVTVDEWTDGTADATL